MLNPEGVILIPNLDENKHPKIVKIADLVNVVE